MDALAELVTKEIKSTGKFKIPGVCMIKTRHKPATKAGKRICFGQEMNSILRSLMDIETLNNLHMCNFGNKHMVLHISGDFQKSSGHFFQTSLTNIPQIPHPHTPRRRCRGVQVWGGGGLFGVFGVFGVFRVLFQTILKTLWLLKTAGHMHIHVCQSCT